MTREYINEFIEWINKEHETDLAQLAQLLQETYEKKAGIRIEIEQWIHEGKMTSYHICYNKKFPDMDISIYYDSPEEGNTGVGFSELTKDDVVKEGDRIFHILNQPYKKVRIVFIESEI